MTERKPGYFSKSNLMLGLNCAKALHLAIHKPKLKSKPDPAQQQIFDQGHEVGAKAREYFDQDGIVIHAKPWEYPLSLASTRKAMESGAQTVYEAAFSDGHLYSRVDILHRKNQEWHLIEVKASNSVKDEHIFDVGIQALTLQRASLDVVSFSVMHLNRDCIFPDLSELFVIQDVTEEVREMAPAIQAQVDALMTMTGGVEPVRALGRHCTEPYECPFKAHCFHDIPDFSVFELPKMDADTAGALVADGILTIEDMPADRTPDNEVLRRAVEVTKSAKRFIDTERIAGAIATWKFPLHFFDFETVMPAIPRYDGTHPYSQVPYQFSCHILATADSNLEHREYLHLERSDPGERLVKELVSVIGSEGSVVSYYAKFEAARMKELAVAFPQYASILNSIVERLVDPLPVIRENVYDREFRGSFSIKAVAPALLGAEFRYDDKDVSNGQMAGVFADKCLRGLTPKAEVPKIREMLLNYCRQDTLAMVELWRWLSRPH